MEAQRGDSKCAHGQQWWLKPTWPGTVIAFVLLFQKRPQTEGIVLMFSRALFHQQTRLSRGIRRKRLLLDSIILLSNHILYSTK